MVFPKSKDTEALCSVTLITLSTASVLCCHTCKLLSHPNIRQSTITQAGGDGGRGVFTSGRWERDMFGT